MLLLHLHPIFLASNLLFLIYLSRRRLHLAESQAFYLIVNRRTIISTSMTLAEVYHTEKDSDGFLYITYAAQEIFG